MSEEFSLSVMRPGKKSILTLNSKTENYRILVPDPEWQDEVFEVLGFIDIPRQGRIRNTILLIHFNEIEDLIEGLEKLKAYKEDN